MAQALLRDLIDRGLDPNRVRLFVVDGAKGLQAAVRTIFGALGVIHRYQSTSGGTSWGTFPTTSTRGYGPR